MSMLDQFHLFLCSVLFTGTGFRGRAFYMSTVRLAYLHKFVPSSEHALIIHVRKLFGHLAQDFFRHHDPCADQHLGRTSRGVEEVCWVCECGTGSSFVLFLLPTPITSTRRANSCMHA